MKTISAKPHSIQTPIAAAAHLLVLLIARGGIAIPEINRIRISHGRRGRGVGRGTTRARRSSRDSSRVGSRCRWYEDITLILLFFVGVHLVEDHKARRVHGAREVRDEGVHVSIDEFVSCVVTSVMARDTTHVESREERGRGEEERKVL
jgi:hypothetical protein